MSFKPKDPSKPKVSVKSETSLAEEQAPIKGDILSKRRPLLSEVPKKDFSASKPSVESKEDKPPPNNLIFLVIGAVTFLLVITIVVMVINGKKQPVNSFSEASPAQSASPWDNSSIPQATQAGQIQESEEERIQKELRESGMGVYNAEESSRNVQVPVQSDTFVKDISGVDVPEMWKAKNVVYIQDFVSYSKNRAVTDTGVELYWLDGTYQGLSCKMTVQYKFFRTMPDEGALLCDIEVVETSEGQKIITWFNPIPNAADAIKGKKR